MLYPSQRQDLKLCFSKELTTFCFTVTDSNGFLAFSSANAVRLEDEGWYINMIKVSRFKKIKNKNIGTKHLGGHILLLAFQKNNNDIPYDALPRCVYSKPLKNKA